jgi:signal transduction histidine kinase
MDSNLEKIYQSFLKLLEPVAPRRVYKIIVEEAASLVQAEYGSILLARPDGGFERAYTNIPKRYRLLRSRKHGYVYRTFKKGWLQVLSKDELSAVHPEFRSRKIKSIILIPLSFNNISIGVLSLQSTKLRHFNQKRRNSLKLFGSAATLKIRNTQLLTETEKALASRDLFISMASHELRTPLTTVQGYAKLIGSRIKSGKPVQTRWVNMLDSEIERMSRITKELLDIDFIRKGRFQYDMDEFRLLTLVNRTKKSFMYSFPDRKLEVKFTSKEDSKAYGDMDKLQQVLSNILSNAVKFSYLNTPISFKVEEEENNYAIEITNLGDGIQKKDTENIFENFYKGDPKKPGMGLGLYIAKTIIDDHRGDIIVKSKPKDKTTFKVVIPQLKKHD